METSSVGSPLRPVRLFAFDRRHPGLPPLSASHAITHGTRVYVGQQSGWDLDGVFHGLGDPAAQAEQAMRNVRQLLEELGSSLEHVCKVTTSLVDRAHRPAVYGVIGRHLAGVAPCGTGLVVAGLAAPEMLVGIDVEAAIPGDGARPERLRRFDLKDWYGQEIAWHGCMAVRTEPEIFVRGQTGSPLDGSGMVGLGRRPEDAAAQAELALSNLRTLVEEAGGALADVCKLTVYILDRAYREAVYPVIGRHLAGVHPVSTGVIVPGFARPEILFELDATVIPSAGAPHRRLRKYHTAAARYGTEVQPLQSEFCMAVVTRDQILLRGQTGIGLDNRFHGSGDAAAQAKQAMENVAVLLAEAGAGLPDVAKATLYVTDRAHLRPALEVLGRRLPHGPAVTPLIVKGLASPELLVEVDITAARPAASGAARPATSR